MNFMYELVLIWSFRCCVMKMNWQGMYDDRRSPQFINGVQSFLHAAEANKQDGFMCCPCGVCKNDKTYSSLKQIHVHLFTSGFMSGYNCWTKHGERGVLMEENEEEDDDNYAGFPEYDGTTMGEENEEEEAEASYEPADDLGRAIADAKRNCESEKKKLKMQRMLEDHKKGLYPNCEDDNTKLGTTLELL